MAFFFFFLFLLHEYLFPSLHCQSISVFRSELNLLFAAYTWLCRSYFFILAITLCLLTGEFRPLVFKLVIDRYVLIAILLMIAFVVSCSSFFSCSLSLRLMTFFSAILGFPPPYFQSIFYRILVCGYHVVYTQYPKYIAVCIDGHLKSNIF